MGPVFDSGGSLRLCRRVRKALHVDDVRIALRPSFNRVLTLVPHAFVEPWGLETVRSQNNLNAATSNGFCFGGTKEQCSESASSMLLVYPDMSKLTASAPRVTVEAGDHVARITPDATRQKHSVEISGLLRVELVDPIGEEGAELLALSCIDGRNDLGFHDALGYWKEASRRLRKTDHL